jgi:hypothetical protein
MSDIRRITASVRSSVAASGSCANQVVLVLRRHEALRHAAEAEHRQADETDVEHHRRERHAQHARDRPGVQLGRLREEAVEAAEEPPEQEVGAALQAIAGRAVRAQQPRRQRRAERQRVERRDHRRDGDGQRELAVELSAQAADERRRHEHRAQDQGDGDDRPRHLVHRLARGLDRRQPELDVPLHVLHHHDGVVDDDADGEDEAEERERVEREAERQHDGERADQRHRHGDERNDRRAPRLQEHHHDDHDQQDGLEQRHDDGADRLADEERRVVDDAVLDAVGERLLQAFHDLIDLRRGLERVRPGPLRHADRDRRLVVEQAAQRVQVGAELDAADVAQARDLPFRRRPHHDPGELLLGAEPALRVHRQLERGVGRRRRRAEHAGRDLDVLLADGADDVGRGQLPRRQLVGIQPHAHAVLAGAEHLHRADAGNARQLVLHLQVREVREVEHVVAIVRRHEMRHEQEVRRRLFGGDADALHVQRQPRQRLRHPVLHLHLRDVEIGAERERHRQRHAAVGGRLREHVEQVLDAVDLLL